MRKCLNEYNKDNLIMSEETICGNQKQELPMKDMFFVPNQDKMRNICRGPHKHNFYKVPTEHVVLQEINKMRNITINGWTTDAL